MRELILKLLIYGIFLSYVFPSCITANNSSNAVKPVAPGRQKKDSINISKKGNSPKKTSKMELNFKNQYQLQELAVKAVTTTTTAGAGFTIINEHSAHPFGTHLLLEINALEEINLYIDSGDFSYTLDGNNYSDQYGSHYQTLQPGYHEIMVYSHTTYANIVVRLNTLDNRKEVTWTKAQNNATHWGNGILPIENQMSHGSTHTIRYTMDLGGTTSTTEYFIVSEKPFIPVCVFSTSGTVFHLMAIHHASLYNGETHAKQLLWEMYLLSQTNIMVQFPERYITEGKFPVNHLPDLGNAPKAMGLVKLF